MHDSDEPKRCPQCGSPVPPGAVPLLCPVCVLTGEPDDDGSDGKRMGSYLLLDEIARGGMGVVYRARQDGLNRIVALKILPGAAFASADFRLRFQREAETVARLKHPGIVAVHEIGQAQGQPFLSMDFIDGPSLAERLAESRMTAEFSAHLVREVAQAVDHAHRHGVAHRDLKPSNILINADNHPVLTDFGLARFLDLESTRGFTLDLMGSPPYLPPERVASGGNANPVAEDVYGLGAVIYHCLTGRPPFVADSLNALLAAVSGSEPVAPRRLNHSVPQDLETICLKCLEKSPAARYSSAAEVADELDRFLRGEPIHARPLAPADLIIRAIRRKPLMASLVLALLAAIISGTVVSLRGWQRAARNAEDFRVMAEQRRIDLYSGNLAAASAAMDSGNRMQARELLRRCRPGNGESELRGPEWFLLSRLLKPREMYSTRAHGHILTSLAWSPSGRTLVSGAHDGSLKSWTLANHCQLLADGDLRAADGQRIHQAAWLPDGRTFLAAEGAFIRCRRPGEAHPLWEIPGRSFSLAADGRTLVVSTGGPFFYEPHGQASLWKLQDTGRPEPLRTLPFPARAVAISPDARWLAAGEGPQSHHDGERGLVLLDLSLPDPHPRPLATSAGVWSLAFSPDSTRLAAATHNSEARVHCFDVRSGRGENLPVKHAARVWTASFTADSKSLLTTSSDRSVCLWPLSGAVPAILPLAHDNEIWASAIHPSGTLAATGDKDGNLKLFPLPPPRGPMEDFPRHPHFRYARPVFSPDSSRLFVCETAPKWRTLAWHPSTGVTEAVEMKFHPLGIGPGDTAIWRDTGTRELKIQARSQDVRTISLPPESWPAAPGMWNLGISPDQRHCYQFAETGHAATADLVTGKIRTLEDFCPDRPTASALSQGGRFLVAATLSQLVIHDFGTGMTTRFPNDPHWAKTIVFSPDCTLMITGGTDGHIILRRLPDFTPVWKLSGHLSEVSGLAISPDGRTLVSSELGSGLRFWRLDTRREVMRLALPEACERIAFSPDGQSLAVTTCPPASPPEAGQVVVIPCPRDGVE